MRKILGRRKSRDERNERVEQTSLDRLWEDSVHRWREPFVGQFRHRHSQLQWYWNSFLHRRSTFEDESSRIRLNHRWAKSPPDSAIFGKATDRTLLEHRTVEVENDATRWNSPVKFDLLAHRRVRHGCIPFGIWKKSWIVFWWISLTSILFEIKLTFGPVEAKKWNHLFFRSIAFDDDSETSRHQKHADQKWNGKTHSEIDVLIDMSTEIGP